MESVVYHDSPLAMYLEGMIIHDLPIAARTFVDIQQKAKVKPKPKMNGAQQIPL